MKVKRVAQNQDAIQNQELLGDEETFGLDQVVYVRMSSLTDNRVLVDPAGDDSSKFNRFLNDMNDIHRGREVTTEVTLLDKYLGNLGETVSYPFADDTYYVAPWLTVEAQEPTREVIDRLSLDDCIDRNTGDSVIHNTSYGD